MTLSILIVAEVSDQNFVDEDIEEEKSKRVKTEELDPHSANDQVIEYVCTLILAQDCSVMLTLKS